ASAHPGEGAAPRSPGVRCRRRGAPRAPPARSVRSGRPPPAPARGSPGWSAGGPRRTRSARARGARSCAGARTSSMDLARFLLLLLRPGLDPGDDGRAADPADLPDPVIVAIADVVDAA